jgi:hypothetical protein
MTVEAAPMGLVGHGVCRSRAARSINRPQPLEDQTIRSRNANAICDAETIGKATLERRGFLGASLALLGLGATLGLPSPARAAANMIPKAVRNLDAAAMKLFDAAEAGDWFAAQQALDSAQAAGAAVDNLEGAYSDAGGQLENFFQVRNNIGADIVEAGTALSAKDRRWLVNSADRIAARAGELSEPFAERSNALVPRIETLLFLARRMRRARVWQDNVGFRAANDDFKRLWQALRRELRGQPAEKRRAIDEALNRAADSSSGADMKALYAAVLDLRDTVG